MIRALFLGLLMLNPVPQPSVATQIVRQLEVRTHLPIDTGLSLFARTRAVQLEHDFTHDHFLASRRDPTRAYGEIIGWFSGEPREGIPWLIRWWYASPPHVAVLTGHWARMGASCAHYSGRYYCAVEFML